MESVAAKLARDDYHSGHHHHHHHHRGKSAVILTWINFITLILSLAILGLGIWLATRHGECEKFLTVPVFIIGAFFLVVSLVAFIGAWFAVPFLLYSYLVVMFFLLLLLAAFIIFVFIITAPGGGHAVQGLKFQEYRLSDYSQWLQDQLTDQSHWAKFRSCLGSSKNCEEIATEYKTVTEYCNADLNPIQSGCCRPPNECCYPVFSPTFFDTSVSPKSSNPDCLTYSNDANLKCYNCNSCKAGVAQEIKQDGHIAGVVAIIIFVILIIIYSLACIAGHKAYYLED